MWVLQMCFSPYAHIPALGTQWLSNLSCSHGAVASPVSAALRARVYFLSPTAEETQISGGSETRLSSNSRPDVLKQEIYKMVNVTQSCQPS